MRIDPAIREFSEWRTRDAEFSHNTWVGEMPGLFYFADFMIDREVGELHEVTPELCAEWKASLGHLAENTRATRLSQLRTFLGYCINRGWLEADPTVLLVARRPAPVRRRQLDAAQLLALIDSCEFPQHRIILALAANLALRQSEIKTLRISDVDLDGQTVLVHVHKTRKTPPDPMPVTAELDVELRRWLAHYARQCVLTRDTLLVPSQHVASGSRRVTYRTDRSVAEPEDVVKAALTRIGWDVVKGEGIHTVRRSVARIFFDAAEADASYHEALLGTMRLLHHDKPETTLGYIGVDRQTQARDRFLRGQRFLSRQAGLPTLALVK
jgi:integrase